MHKLCMQNNDSHAAHENTDLQTVHEFLTRVLLTSMQHTRYVSHAGQEVWLSYSTQNMTRMHCTNSYS